MATGITGRLIRRTTKEPLQGITVVAVNASTGAESSTTTTTDTKGFFELNGLTSAVYFPKALVSGDDWDLLPNIAEIYTDEIHIASNGSLTIDGAVAVPKDIVHVDLSASVSAGQNVRGVRSDLASSSGGNVTALAGYASQSAAGNATGAVASAETTQGSGASTNVLGLEAFGIASGSSGGTITELGAIAATVTPGAATATTAYGIKVGNTGGATNDYGVYINSPSSGTGNYAIYSSATAQSEFAGSVKSSSDTGGVGYATGAGGTVTQLTSKATSVTLNKISGQITTHNAALGAATSVVFQLANSTIAATDVVVVHASNNAATDNVYSVEVIMQGAGFANLRLTNVSAGSLSEAVLINFAVIKAVAA